MLMSRLFLTVALITTPTLARAQAEPIETDSPRVEMLCIGLDAITLGAGSYLAAKAFETERMYNRRASVFFRRWGPRLLIGGGAATLAAVGLFAFADRVNARVEGRRCTILPARVHVRMGGRNPADVPAAR